MHYHFWLFVFQLGTFFFYPMWFNTVRKTYAALPDSVPNLLAFECTWQGFDLQNELLLIPGPGPRPGMQSVLSDLVCVAGAGFWLLCVGTVAVVHIRALAR